MNKTMKILAVRTDRMGDVLLTTPAFAALRRAFPRAEISVLVNPSTREIVDGNPHIDDIIIDDKHGRHRGALGFWRLVLQLRRRRFDVAVIFHTKKRTNVLCFLAGIPRRVGYRNNKCGFLLTEPLKDRRPEGRQHEAEYCLDVVRTLGVRSDALDMHFPLKEEAELWADRFLNDNGIASDVALVAVHPGASCVSKRWPPERFAGLINRLHTRYRVRSVLVGAAAHENLVRVLKERVDVPLLDLTGITSLAQLASLLKRCRLLVSNDSGPVHLATAVSTPVISIFGRNQAGLSPVRWRPLGPRDRFVHKEVGCEVCLAHNCAIDFKCLKEIPEDEIMAAVVELLDEQKITGKL